MANDISSIVIQANAIKNVLQPWADELGGLVIVCSNIHDMWNQAKNTSITPRALVAFEGENIRGDFSIAASLGRVDRDWVVAIMRGQSLTVQRGTDLSNPVGNAKAFYDILEVARDVLRTMRFSPNGTWPPSQRTENPIDYKGIRPMQTLNGQILDGNTIHFSIGTQIQQVLGTTGS